MSDGGDFLRRLVALLDQARIPHMIAGSFASTLHGTPRSTQDIDLVIDPSGQALLAFVAGLDVKRGELDQAYIERWAKELGVLDAWRRAQPSG